MEQTWIKELFEKGHSAGISSMEVYCKTEQSKEVSIEEGEVRSLKELQVTGCFIEGSVSGKYGYVYTENFALDHIPFLIDSMSVVASCTEKGFQGRSLQGKPIDKGEVLSPISDLKEAVENSYQNIEQEIRKGSVDTYRGKESVVVIEMQNDQGGHLKESQKAASFHVAITSRRNQQVQTAYEYQYAPSLSELAMEEEARKTAQIAEELLDASQALTGRYKVVLSSQVVTEMFGMYLPCLGADKVHQHLSYWEGKLGEQIAHSSLKMVEDPQAKKGLTRRSFDDEGTATRRKELIANGILQTYLYNREEGEKDGVASTGNGFKTEMASVPEIGVTNVILSGNQMPEDEMLQRMGDGIYITYCDGMFAGANVVTGDFSLLSKGFLVEQGKKTKPLHQITIAGNFFEMLKEVSMMGQDSRIDGFATGTIIAPSIYAGELSVAGK